MTRIKVCGITNVDDARAAVAAGVDAIGLVFAPSKRRVDFALARDIVAAAPPLVNVIGVFMDQDLRVVIELVGVLRLDAAQLHGAEPPEYCEALACKVIKRFDVPPDATAATLNERIAAYETATPLLDPGAGDGQVFDWSLARDLERPVIIAGGLSPENVSEAIRAARPLGVDVASGVEAVPGRKDHEKLRAFVRAVREADG